MLPNSSYLRCLLLAAVTLLLGGCGKEVERHKLDVAHLRTAWVATAIGELPASVTRRAIDGG